MAPFLGSACTIFAAGEIDSDAGKRLEAFLQANRVPVWSHIYLDSPGGNPVGAIEMGRVIRKHRMNTDIGAFDSPDRVRTAGCFSACALAFLGGEYRYRVKGSGYGIHQFAYSSADPRNVERAQLLAAAEVDYIREMGVDPSLWSLKAGVSANAIYEPSEEKLIALGVLNYGRSQVKWSIESTDLGLYLKGEQATKFGINKFIIACHNNRFALDFIFDPQGRGEEASSYRADSLVVDGHMHPLQRYLLHKDIQNGLLNALYDLTPEYLNLIQNAKTVGVTTSASDSSPVFLGFDAMPFAEGAGKLKGLRNTCIK
jgi:hypothetical protein